MNTTVIGLHLAETNLLTAELRRAGRSIEVTLARRPASAAGLTGSLSSPAPAASAARTLKIACLPAHWVISRCWDLPKADDQTLRRMIALRLEADLPLPIDKVAWDCRLSHCHPDTTTVFVQAARDDLLAGRMTDFAAASAPPDVLTTHAEALQALYRYGLKRPHGDAAEALILAQPNAWLVATFVSGAVRSLHCIDTDSRPDLLARQSGQLLESQPHPITKAYWLAPDTLAPARDCLAQRIRIPVESAEPSPTLTRAAASLTQADLAEYAIPLGLALAGLIEPTEFIRLAGQPRQSDASDRAALGSILTRPGRCALVAAACTLLAIILHVAAVTYESHKMRTLLATSDTAAALGKDFQSKVQAYQRLQTYRIDIEKTVAHLAAAVPDSIVVSSIQISRQSRMVLKGVAKDPKAVFTLADALRKSKRFAGVNWDRAEPAQGGTFTISMDLADVKPFNPQGPTGAKWR